MSVSIDYTGGVFKANKAKSVGTVTAGTGPYNLASASYDSVSFSVASQETTPNNIAFNDDGTSMYIIGSGTDAIYQYTLSTAWDLSTASYASKSFSTTDDNTPRGFTFNNDGTKIYYVGSTADTVYQYSLGTAYDISTASTDNKSLSVGTQASIPTGVVLKSDGSKLYVCDGTSDAIYQYSLSTPFDVSTGSYDNVSFSFSSQGTNTQSIFFTPDGTSLFVCDTANDAVYKYSLSTAWDVSTLSYANESFSLSGQDDPFGVAFKSDGTKMYMVGVTNDAVYQYSTGTATTLDLSTGNYFSHTPSVNTVFAFNNPPASGTAAGFALALTGANVAETYDIANASYDSVSLNIATEEPIPTGLTFSADGTNAYIAGPNNDTVYQYSLSTAWDLSTASYASKSLSVSGQALLSGAIQFKDDGTSLYVLDRNLDDVFQYDLTTAWDVSTASYASKSMDATSQDTAPRGMYFKPDGTKVYIAGDTNNSIYQYALSTAWDISTGSFETGKSFSVNTQTTYPCGVYINSNGDKMWVASTTDGYIYQYSLSTAWDVSTASYDSVSFDASTQVTTGLHDLYFKSDGSKMYLISNSTDAIFQYTTQATSAATFTYPSSVKFPSGTAPAGPAIGETDVLVFYTDDGGTTYQGFRAGDAMA
jgi:DNA-binding beta-propeller fold protein YncE